MRNRGKREEEYYNYNNGYGEGYVEFTCKKHPSSSSISRGGICAFCLTDRLYQLVCPQCGEQRLSSSSSCSCSCTNTNTNNNTNNNTADLFSSNNPNNYSSSADVGNVGRISFLLENDNKVINNNNYYEPKIEPRLSSASHVEDFNTLRRSNSICVGVDRKESSKDKFWKIGRLFRKKKEKTYNNNNNNINEEEENININNNNNNYDGNNNNNNGVTRSRSVSNFRGFYDTEETGNNNFPISTSSAARASSVSTGNFYGDSAKMSCFSESEARFSNFDYLDVNGLNKNNNYNYNNNNIYSVKESEFTSSDDPAYIDLKLDGMSSTSDYHHSKKVPDLATMRRSRLGTSTKEFGFNRRNQEHDMFMRSGSCRRSSVTERELRNCRKSSKVWKWFFKHQSSSSNRDDRDDPHQDFNNSFDPS